MMGRGPTTEAGAKALMALSVVSAVVVWWLAGGCDVKVVAAPAPPKATAGGVE